MKKLLLILLALMPMGVFAEGRYIKFWDNPAYDFKLGLNYQFKW